MKDGFFKLAAASPQVRVADVDYNSSRIREIIADAAAQGCGAVCFPELAVTAYTCGDLFQSSALIKAAEQALSRLMEETKDLDILCAVGVPVGWRGALYNAAAVFHRGRLLGLPVKSFVPNYGEFYEARHFTPAPEARQTVTYCGQQVPLGRGLVFECQNVEGLSIGVEICEDLWGPEPPSAKMARAGATVILNPSCSNEVAGKADYRRDLVRMWSGHIMGAYVYADAGPGESTGDLVFAGHDLIAEDGALLAESGLFAGGLLTAEVDLEKLRHDRRRSNTWQDAPEEAAPVAFSYLEETIAAFEPQRVSSRQPFVPEGDADRDQRCQDILTMQAQGLATRMEHIGCKNALLALSGGLDSTLALLVTARTFDILGLERTGILAISMPCFGTTSRTKSNAQRIAEGLGVEFREISIEAAVRQHFADIGQPEDRYDAAFENAQARERTQVLMDMANQRGGLMIGTGDLSELALGWSTYNGDHMSMYSVNGDVPKTLVRHLVRFEAQRFAESAPELSAALLDVLATPVSPELLPPKDGEIAQKTEELVGPYELHDFFLYHMLRYGFGPGKIYRLACRTFRGSEYTPEVIKTWLRVFCRRFFSQQFKRSCLPDGPKVGTIGVSPRGDWRMPSDASAAVWMREIEEL